MSCSNDIQYIEIKEWDTLTLSCTYLGEDGLPLSLFGLIVKANMVQVLSSDELVQLEVEITNEDLGTFVLTYPEDRLPPAKYKVDILFEDATGVRKSSQTFGVISSRAITDPD